jgi:hypothetical protein
MSKTDGIGVLSLSLEFLHVKRWPRAPAETSPKPPGATPAVFVAVNFDEPAPLDADVTELPEGDVCKRADLAANAALWHGLRLTSMQDILHVEVRSKDTAFEDTGDDYVVMASFSGPVTSFLEEAFLESDRRGAKTSFELGDVASAQFRVKFHLQADILRALCDGVGLEVASADTIKAFAPHAVSLCGACGDAHLTFSTRREKRRKGKKKTASTPKPPRRSAKRARRFADAAVSTVSISATPTTQLSAGRTPRSPPGSSGSSRPNARMTEPTRKTEPQTSSGFSPTRGEDVERKSALRSRSQRRP